MSVSYRRDGSVAHIELARADARNAMNRDMYAAVNRAFAEFASDDDARVAVFSSSNPDAFCAGVDIKDIHKALTDEGLSLEQLAARCTVDFEELGGLPKPVIAAIHGHCVGEGMVMTLFCDIRIAADDASFALPEAKIGVPSINGTIRAVQLAGHGAAMELLLTGEPRDAAWAKSAGLINTIVPRSKLLQTATRMAESIAANGEEAIRIMRQLGERALEEPFNDLVRYGVELRTAMSSEDMVERQGAFVDRSSSKNPSGGEHG